MTSEIVCAVISGVCTLVVCLLNNRAQQRKADEDQDKRMTEISHRHEMSMQQVEANISQKLETVGSDVWMKCPSGWIAAYYKSTQYIK